MVILRALPAWAVTCVLAMWFMANAVAAQTLRHPEILGRPTDHSIAIHVMSDETVDVCALYGTSPSLLDKRTPWISCVPGQGTTIELNELQADMAYSYRCCVRATGRTDSVIRPVRTFHTQRAPASTFTFVVQADPHMDEQTDTAILNRCLLNQLEDAPDFMIDLGDFLMSDKLKNTAGKITHDTITWRCHLLRSAYEQVSHSVPLFIALGNHEGESGWNLNGTANNVAVWGTNDRKQFFPNPTPSAFYASDTTSYPFVGQRNSYYAWSWGSALFIVIDPYWHTTPKPDSLHGWRWTLGKQQYDWLKSTLERNTLPFVFVFAHQLIGGDPDGRGGVEFSDLYEWGGKNLDGTDGWAANRPGWPMPIKDLLAAHRVSIFFHGHDHFFAQQSRDCLTYQETPQPGHPNFNNAGQADDYGYLSGVILPNSGHLRVTVSPERTNVEYVRAYKTANETSTRRNKDVSAQYSIAAVNCYDSVTSSVPVIWNAAYANEMIVPNPSSTQMSIGLSCPVDDLVSITIVDEIGRPCRQLLVNSIVPQGEHYVLWDGRDDRGSMLPAGTYTAIIVGTHHGWHSLPLIRIK